MGKDHPPGRFHKPDISHAIAGLPPPNLYHDPIHL